MLERIFRRLWNLGKNMDRMLEETESPKYRTECRKQNQYEYRVLFDDTIEINALLSRFGLRINRYQE